MKNPESFKWRHKHAEGGKPLNMFHDSSKLMAVDANFCEMILDKLQNNDNTTTVNVKF